MAQSGPSAAPHIVNFFKFVEAAVEANDGDDAQVVDCSNLAFILAAARLVARAVLLVETTSTRDASVGIKN